MLASRENRYTPSGSSFWSGATLSDDSEKLWTYLLCSKHVSRCLVGHFLVCSYVTVFTAPFLTLEAPIPAGSCYLDLCRRGNLRALGRPSPPSSLSSHLFLCLPVILFLCCIFFYLFWGWISCVIMYIWMYVCTYVCMYVCTYICMYVCM
jgi:hypothetical protein